MYCGMNVHHSIQHWNSNPFTKQPTKPIQHPLSTPLMHLLQSNNNNYNLIALRDYS